MLSLVIDSATKNMYMALVLDDKIVEEKYFSGSNDHAKNIVSGIQEMLEKNSYNVSNLDTIVCGVGPGSYTGVRMAVTVSKMLASLKKIKLKSISTLHLMATSSDKRTLSYIDARNGNVFGGIYEGEKIIVEKFLPCSELEKYDHFEEVSQDNFKVDPIKAIKYSKDVEEAMLLVPNYLRDTEAERNYADANK